MKFSINCVVHQSQCTCCVVLNTTSPLYTFHYRCTSFFIHTFHVHSYQSSTPPDPQFAKRQSHPTSPQGFTSPQISLHVSHARAPQGTGGYRSQPLHYDEPRVQVPVHLLLDTPSWSLRVSLRCTCTSDVSLPQVHRATSETSEVMHL